MLLLIQHLHCSPFSHLAFKSPSSRPPENLKSLDFEISAGLTGHLPACGFQRIIQLCFGVTEILRFLVNWGFLEPCEEILQKSWASVSIEHILTFGALAPGSANALNLTLLWLLSDKSFLNGFSGFSMTSPRGWVTSVLTHPLSSSTSLSFSPVPSVLSPQYLPQGPLVLTSATAPFTPSLGAPNELFPQPEWSFPRSDTSCVLLCQVLPAQSSASLFSALAHEVFDFHMKETSPGAPRFTNTSQCASLEDTAVSSTQQSIWS